MAEEQNKDQNKDGEKKPGIGIPKGAYLFTKKNADKLVIVEASAEAFVTHSNTLLQKIDALTNDWVQLENAIKANTDNASNNQSSNTPQAATPQPASPQPNTQPTSGGSAATTSAPAPAAKPADNNSGNSGNTGNQGKADNQSYRRIPVWKWDIDMEYNKATRNKGGRNGRNNKPDEHNKNPPNTPPPPPKGQAQPQPNQPNQQALNSAGNYDLGQLQVGQQSYESVKVWVSALEEQIKAAKQTEYADAKAFIDDFEGGKVNKLKEFHFKQYEVYYQLQEKLNATAAKIKEEAEKAKNEKKEPTPELKSFLDAQRKINENVIGLGKIMSMVLGVVIDMQETAARQFGNFSPWLNNLKKAYEICGQQPPQYLVDMTKFGIGDIVQNILNNIRSKNQAHIAGKAGKEYDEANKEQK